MEPAEPEKIYVQFQWISSRPAPLLDLFFWAATCLSHQSLITKITSLCFPGHVV